MIIHYTVPEIWCVMDIIVIFILGYTSTFHPPPPTPYSAKNKNFKRMKKVPADIIILHKCTKNHDHMIICYTVPDIWHVLDVIVIFHLGLFFALLPSDRPKHESFKKNEKAT